MVPLGHAQAPSADPAAWQDLRPTPGHLRGGQGAHPSAGLQDPEGLLHLQWQGLILATPEAPYPETLLSAM